MKKHKTIATVAAGLALSGVTGMGLSAVLASPAGAATPSALAAPSTAAPSTAAPSTAGHHPLRAWPRAHRKAVARDTIRISAKAIAVTPKDLVRALRSGQSIAEVAQAHNVDVQAVVNALVQAGDAQVGRAVAAHRLTPAQGDMIEAALPAAVTKIVNHVYGSR
jgi:hypothetical protein